MQRLEMREECATDARRRRPRPRGVACFTVALALLGCGSVLPSPKTVAQPATAFEEVRSSPPPARVERVPPSPADGAVWIDGEWRWNGSRWEWIAGRWVKMPPGEAFSPWAARRRDDGVLLVAPGTFRDARTGKEVSPPPALAVGRAREDAVVGPEGNPQDTAPNVTPERRTRRK